MISKIAVQKLRDGGMTYQQIGDIVGISRQRVHQILKGYKSTFEWHPKPEDKKRKKDYFRENYISMKDPITGKQRAIRVIGKRTRPNDICELCGRDSKMLVYHHWDNSNYHRGVWLCYRCHHFAHSIEDGYINRNLHIKYLQLKQTIEQE